jgi:hypothetical protein
VIAASVYTVLAFAGFEGAAPLAEESRNPGRTVQRAVVYSALGIGVLYVFTTYAELAGQGDRLLSLREAWGARPVGEQRRVGQRPDPDLGRDGFRGSGLGGQACVEPGQAFDHAGPAEPESLQRGCQQQRCFSVGELQAPAERGAQVIHVGFEPPDQPARVAVRGRPEPGRQRPVMVAVPAPATSTAMIPVTFSSTTLTVGQ